MEKIAKCGFSFLLTLLIISPSTTRKYSSISMGKQHLAANNKDYSYRFFSLDDNSSRWVSIKKTLEKMSRNELPF